MHVYLVLTFLASLRNTMRNNFVFVLLQHLAKTIPSLGDSVVSFNLLSIFFFFNKTFSHHYMGFMSIILNGFKMEGQVGMPQFPQLFCFSNF